MNDLYKNISKYKDKIMSFALNGCTLIVCAIISTGFDFSWSVFSDWTFYIKTITDYILMIAIFNTSFNDTIRTCKALTTGDYYESRQRTNRYIKRVHDEHLEKYIEQKAEERSKSNQEKAIWSRLNAHTTGLSINENGQLECKPYDNLEEFFRAKHVTKARKKKILNDIRLALNGDVQYLKIYGYQVLGYDVGDKEQYKDEAVTLNRASEDLKMNGRKTIIFLCSTALINVIAWDSINYASFWVVFVAHATLILSNILSAIKYAYDRISVLTSIEVNKSTFLNTALGDYDKDVLETKNITEEIPITVDPIIPKVNTEPENNTSLVDQSNIDCIQNQDVVK